MIDIAEYCGYIANLGVDFVTGVPDSLLNDFCCYIEENLDPKRHIIAANEGNAIAIACGYHLATGGIPMVYMQNSGLGNAMNPLISLTHPEVYAIPMILLIGWRGDPAIKDHVQHKVQGALTPITLENLEIPYFILDNDQEDAFHKTKLAYDTANESGSTVALIVKKRVLERGEKDSSLKPSNELPLSREEAISTILEIMPSDAIYVASTGRITRELHAQRVKRGEPHNRDFLMVGSMGHASQIALGLALAKPNRTIVCLDGDAAAIMHMGGMSIIGRACPLNLWHFVLNNGAHESVGGQMSSGINTDFTTVATACGYATSKTYLTTRQEIAHSVYKLEHSQKPKFFDIRIHKGIRSGLPALHVDHKQDKTMLMQEMVRENND